MSTILVPTDGSPAAEQAIGHAVSIADELGKSVHGLYVVHLTPDADYDLGIGYPTIQEAEEDRGELALEAVERQCEKAEVDFEGHLRDGPPAETITTVAREIEADLIAMGTHGESRLSRPLLGSTTIEVLRRGDHPVLAVPEEFPVPAGGYDQILVPTDASDGSRGAEEMAIEWAEGFGGSIHGLYVVELALSHSAEVEAALDADGKKAVADLEERATAAGVDATTTVETGIPHEVIRSEADETDADLIVMGSHGRSGLERTFLGSVSERTVRTATRPILVV